MPRNKIQIISKTDEIIDQIAAEDPDLLTADGFDDAILGIVEGCGRETVVCYDYDKCVEILMRENSMDEEEARNFLDFNTLGAYVGEKTPMFLHNWRGTDNS